MNGFPTNFPNQFNNNFNGQNGMNQMGMNPMGMNPMGMNQMGMNQMGNQMGNNMNQIMMNQILMNQMGMNPMAFNQMGMAGQMNMNDMSKLIQMNNQNFNNMNNNNMNNNNFIQDSSNGITVTFEKNDPVMGELKITIQCLFTEKIEKVIEKYRIKSGDDNMFERFVFNTKNLCPELTVAEQGLLSNSIIKVIDIKDMKGA